VLQLFQLAQPIMALQQVAAVAQHAVQCGFTGSGGQNVIVTGVRQERLPVLVRRLFQQ